MSEHCANRAQLAGWGCVMRNSAKFVFGLICGTAVAVVAPMTATAAQLLCNDAVCRSLSEFDFTVTGTNSLDQSAPLSAPGITQDVDCPMCYHRQLLEQYERGTAGSLTQPFPLDSSKQHTFSTTKP